ncbi:hypothetical protein ELI02_27545 (plasmid) [Rhizobium leguminosarum]|uniref:Uncharacterized protein n=1 Tax=Rhizobium leguminosarum TaxID=384 RepID=A0A4Q8XR33_RHILE|nr:hypothetical protein [Rhizobium leguminosarum]TAV82175.1 hypothetical protein ELI21_32990 [Rhizobium leguminosarum]TAV83156.1 hypothetical protein ELI22_30085 [Rhizobium leguminosarum]TAW25901.1 hypothetical protein ELI23_31600 [Rhizobium leguminosarum]TAX23196.1 hypothetical protein ELI04_30060 [Rhizobium leguminosarum]TAX46847.1 hypothetical protein ELI02_27545 [Rhizobium leguminosarum]
MNRWQARRKLSAGLLLAAGENTDALFSDPGGELREIAIRRQQAETVERTIVQQSIAWIIRIMSESFPPSFRQTALGMVAYLSNRSARPSSASW